MNQEDIAFAAELFNLLHSVSGEKTEGSSNRAVAVIGLLAVIAGALITGFFQAAIKFFDVKRESAAITGALMAEVDALLLMLEERGYRRGIEDRINALNEDRDFDASMAVKVPDSYNAVYRAHVADLGKINPETAYYLASFYQLINGLVTDISPGGALAASNPPIEALLEAKKILDIVTSERFSVAFSTARREASSMDLSFYKRPESGT